MTLDDSIQGFRLRVVREAQRSGNVSATCRRYDVSRTVFYRWRARLARYGPDGLHPTRRTARPGRAPQLSVADERRVIAEALAWPTRGPQWVSDRLALQGLVVAPVTAWRVLRRVGLNHRLARLAVLEDQSATRGLLTERTARRRRGRHVAAAQPGDLCSLDSFYIGKLKGVGKVWQLTACDCASSFGWARIVVGEVTAARMAAFLTDVVRPGYRAAGWRLKRVLTDNGKEFKASFVTTCADRQVRHTRTKPRHAWTNGFVERLQGTMLHEHWRVEFRRHYFRSARALQRSLDRFLVFYNTQRPHRGYRLQGRTPATVFHGAVAACTSTPASPDRAGVRSEHVDGTVNTIPELDTLVSRSARSHLTLPVAFGALALALGSLFVYPRQWTRGFLINDEAWYAEPARNLAAGRGFVTKTLYPMFAADVESLPMQEPFKQIGYPLVGALVSTVTGLSDQLFVIVALVGFALTGMATWLVAVTIVRNRIAAGAITLATIGNPVFWGWWTAALPESLFTAVFLAGIWLLLLNSPKARFGAGVLLAASIYVKGFAVLYLPLAGAFVVFGTTRPRARHVMGFAAGAVLTFALAEIALPTGTSQLSGASSQYAGSMLLYETRGAYPAHEGPLYDTTPLEPFGYVLTHPIDYGEKVARMMIRTKQTVEVLGGPAVGGVLFPLLLLIGFSVGHDLFGWLRQVRGPTLGGQDPHVTSTRLLLAGLLLVNFVFFWGGNFKDRYFAHLFPLMLAAAYLEFNRLVPDAANWWRKIPRLIVVLAAGYFLAYPPAVGLWKAYRDPYAYLGRMLAVRWVDYAEVAGTVVAHVPADGMVMSDMAHEITWYTDRPTVFFPGSEDQLDYLLDKFDVDAMYEHPRTAREWSSIDERFELVDEVNPRRFATLSLFGGAGVFFSIPPSLRASQP